MPIGDLIEIELYITSSLSKLNCFVSNNDLFALLYCRVIKVCPVEKAPVDPKDLWYVTRKLTHMRTSVCVCNDIGLSFETLESPLDIKICIINTNLGE